MDIEIRPEDQAFADEVRRWLDEHLVGEFAAHRGVGRSGRFGGLGRPAALGEGTVGGAAGSG